VFELGELGGLHDAGMESAAGTEDPGTVKPEEEESRPSEQCGNASRSGTRKTKRSGMARRRRLSFILIHLKIRNYKKRPLRPLTLLSLNNSRFTCGDLLQYFLLLRREQLSSTSSSTRWGQGSYALDDCAETTEDPHRPVAFTLASSRKTGSQGLLQVHPPAQR